MSGFTEGTFNTSRDSHNKWALSFNGAKYNHVNYGIIRVPDTSYGNGGFECWCKPLGTGYLISEGAGGAHALLFGFAGSEAAGYTLTGNVWNSLTGVATSFTTTEAVPHGKVCKVGVYFLTSNKILVCINDVPSNIVAWDGVRRVSAITDCIAFIGGSDHQNFTGLIYAWRYWENDDPIFATGLQTFVRNPRPDNLHIGSFYNGTDQINMGIIADYRTKSTADFGNGLNGSRRGGFLAETLSTGSAGETQSFSFSPANNLVTADQPQWVVSPISVADISTPAKTPTPNALYEDTFGGMNVNLWDRGTLGLGTTETGNKTWTGADIATYGKQYGGAFTNNTANGAALLEGVGVNKTIIWEKPNARIPLGVGAVHQFIFRYVSAGNYTMLYIDEYSSCYIIDFVGGVQQPTTATLTWGLDWTQAKVVLSATDIRIYKNGVEVPESPVSTTVNAAGTGCGWKPSSPLLRLTRIAVV